MVDDELTPEEEGLLDEEIAHASAILDSERAAYDRQLEAEVFGPDETLRTFLGDAQPKRIEEWGEGFDPGGAEAEWLSRLPQEGFGDGEMDAGRLDDHEGRLLTLEDPDPQPELLPDDRWRMFAVLVWRDGGASDGNKTTQCNRTYTAKTPDSAKTHGTELTPDKVRPQVGRMQVPSDTGDGVVGLGYYDGDGAFCLYDANECVYAEACP